MPLPQIDVEHFLNCPAIPDGNGATAAFNAASAWAGLNVPSERISAAPADTTGAAMLVPMYCPYVGPAVLVAPELRVEMMRRSFQYASPPGAEMSSVEPQLE